MRARKTKTETEQNLPDSPKTMLWNVKCEACWVWFVKVQGVNGAHTQSFGLKEGQVHTLVVSITHQCGLVTTLLGKTRMPVKACTTPNVLAKLVNYDYKKQTKVSEITNTLNKQCCTGKIITTAHSDPVLFSRGAIFESVSSLGKENPLWTAQSAANKLLRCCIRFGMFQLFPSQAVVCMYTSSEAEWKETLHNSQSDKNRKERAVATKRQKDRKADRHTFRHSDDRTVCTVRPKGTVRSEPEGGIYPHLHLRLHKYYIVRLSRICTGGNSQREWWFSEELFNDNITNTALYSRYF